MSWDKITNHLFEKYCVEGKDLTFTKLMREHDQNIKNQAIDDFLKALKEKYPYYVESFGCNVNQTFHKEIDEIAEELKHPNYLEYKEGDFVCFNNNDNIGLITKVIYETVNHEVTNNIYCYEVTIGDINNINNIPNIIVYPEDIKQKLEPTLSLDDDLEL